MSTPSLPFPKSAHLRRPAEFKRLYDGQVRAGDGHLLIFAQRNDLGTTRIGLSVSKKHGNAVRRNRLKRLMREAFRLSRPQLSSGLDLILIPRHNSGASLADYCDSIVQTVRRVERRLDKPAD